MAQCPNCGGDHGRQERDENLVTVTLPKFQWEEMLSLVNLAIVGMSPNANIERRMQAAVIFMQNQDVIILDVAPACIAISKVVKMHDDCLDFFEGVLAHVKGEHGH